MSDIAAAAETIASPDPLLNRQQIALIFNVSENTINKWLIKGMPCETEGGKGRAYEFNAAACRAWFGEVQAAKTTRMAVTWREVKAGFKPTILPLFHADFGLIFLAILLPLLGDYTLERKQWYRLDCKTLIFQHLRERNSFRV